MSDISDLSISVSSSEETTRPELDNTKDLIAFFSKNNTTLSALYDTYRLMGKNRTEYFIRKDIEHFSKFELKYYITCDSCRSYKCFDSNLKKKVCVDCLRELKVKESNFFYIYSY